MATTLDICIVTADFVGPIRNGGIGTAYHALALALARAGHRVTVLYTWGTWCENGTIGEWVQTYSRQGITLAPMPSCGAAVVCACPYARSSYEAYLWLSAQEKAGRCFDVIHFHEWRGIGFYSAAAKRQGLALRRSVLVAGAHSPALWHQRGMNQYITAFEDLQSDHLERGSVAMADVLISPSQYMLDWMSSQGWTLPQRVLVRQNVLAENDIAPESVQSCSAARSINEIVFFGRLETRKGLALVCDALDLLCGSSPELTGNIAVTFLGKCSQVEGIDARAYLQRRCGKWKLSRWQVIDTLDHAGALDYLCGNGRLALMASLVENSPYTLLECLAAGIACLCSDLPGNRELIDPADAPATVFVPRPAALAARLEAALRQGVKPARPAVSPQTTRKQWLDWHEQIATSIANVAHATIVTDVAGDPPLVSVCIAHRNRPALLAQAIESIRRQDYPQVQVILVDDGSTQQAALDDLAGLEAEFARRKWKIIRQENQYLGAARNTAAKAADGQYLLFMDDDNYALPNEISTFVKAAQSSGADMLTCVFDTFSGDGPPPALGTDPSAQRWLPLGGAVAVGMFSNLYGDANALIKKDVLEKLGGFTIDWGVGHEDWELFARASLAGYRVEVVPEVLYRYRVDRGSMLRTTSHYVNHMRSLRPYLEKVGPQLAPALEYAQGMFFWLLQHPAVLPPTESQPLSHVPIAPPAALPVEMSSPIDPLPFDAIAMDVAPKPIAPPGNQPAQNEPARLAPAPVAPAPAPAPVAPAPVAPAPVAPPQPAQNPMAEAAASQRRVDEYWDSLTWRFTRPMRALIWRFTGRAAPGRPVVCTRDEADRAVNEIRSSASWELGAPLRMIGRLFQSWRRR